MSKVTVVGAGNVGATCANVLAFNEVADEVVMLDVKEGVSEGKAMDMMQTAQLLGFDTKIVGCTNDYEKTANSDVVVITSGIPRKPGMTREELIGVNAGIVKSVAENILKYSPNAILVVISNPMDTMTYLALKSLGLPKNRVIGMGGALDSSRFKYFLSQALGCNANEVEGMVIGGHGDTTMIPLARLATYKGIPVSSLLSAENLQEVKESDEAFADIDIEKMSSDLESGIKIAERTMEGTEPDTIRYTGIYELTCSSAYFSSEEQGEKFMRALANHVIETVEEKFASLDFTSWETVFAGVDSYSS